MQGIAMFYMCHLYVLMQVKVYMLDGYSSGTKFTLHCRQCNVSYN